MTVSTVTASTTATAVLTPTLIDAIQAAQSVATQVNALLQTVEAAVAQAQFAEEQAEAAADQAVAVLTSVSSLTLANLTTLISNLPTTQPSSSGQLWNDGGVISIS